MRYPELKTTEELSSKWLAVVRKAFTETDGTARKVGEALGATLGAGVGAAVVEGLSEWVAYAGAAMGEDATAIDEEEATVAASWRMVRPVLQAKLQARLDALDEKLVGQARCEGCLGTAESQVRRSRN